MRERKSKPGGGLTAPSVQSKPLGKIDWLRPGWGKTPTCEWALSAQDLLHTDINDTGNVCVHMLGYLALVSTFSPTAHHKGVSDRKD